MANPITSPQVSNLFTTDVILGGITAKSAIAQLSKEIPLNVQGSTVTRFNVSESNLVAEGGTKPENDTSILKITVDSKKFVYRFPVTMEAIMANEGLYNNLLAEVTTSLAADLDKAVLGLKGTQAQLSNFDVLTEGTEEVTVTDAESFWAAVSEVSDDEVSMLITNKMFARLNGLRNSNGTHVLNIDAVNGTIDGIPYAKVSAPLALAIVGPFASDSVYGMTNVVTRSNPYGAGWEQNIVDHITEAFGAFRVSDKAKFVQVKLAAAGLGE